MESTIIVCVAWAAFCLFVAWLYMTARQEGKRQGGAHARGEIRYTIHGIRAVLTHEYHVESLTLKQACDLAVIAAGFEGNAGVDRVRQAVREYAASERFSPRDQRAEAVAILNRYYDTSALPPGRLDDLADMIAREREEQAAAAGVGGCEPERFWLLYIIDKCADAANLTRRIDPREARRIANERQRLGVTAADRPSLP